MWVGAFEGWWDQLLASSSPVVSRYPVRPQAVGLDFSQGEAAANYRHSNSLEVHQQSVAAFGRMRFALPGSDQIGRLSDYRLMTIHWLRLIVLADGLYSVEY